MRFIHKLIPALILTLSLNLFSTAHAAFEGLGFAFLATSAMGVDGATYRTSPGVMGEGWIGADWLGENFSMHFSGSYVPLSIRSTGDFNINELVVGYGFELHPRHKFMVKPFAGLDLQLVTSWWSQSDSRFAMNLALQYRQGLGFNFSDSFTMALTYPITLHLLSQPMMFWNAEVSFRWNL